VEYDQKIQKKTSFILSFIKIMIYIFLIVVLAPPILYGIVLAIGAYACGGVFGCSGG